MIALSCLVRHCSINVLYSMYFSLNLHLFWRGTGWTWSFCDSKLCFRIVSCYLFASTILHQQYCIMKNIAALLILSERMYYFMWLVLWLLIEWQDEHLASKKFCFSSFWNSTFCEILLIAEKLLTKIVLAIVVVVTDFAEKLTALN